VVTISKATKRRALSLYKKAKDRSLKDICDELGISTSTINHWAKLEGLERPLGKKRVKA
jgi:hypothetical protein